MGSARGALGTEEAALGLAFASHAGCLSVLRFLEHEGPEAVWRASLERLLGWGLRPRVAHRFAEKRRIFALDETRELVARSGLRFIAYGSTYYPAELVHLQYPPAGLFARASHDALARLVGSPRVAVVGTRRATPYGLKATDMLASAFGAAGVAVVSGLALGIDGCAHKAALEAGGLTIAVLGCGADVVYPRRHKALYGQIGQGGAVLSELPPGSPPTRWSFPQRNRILAALGDAVLVTEGSLTSGALQTADWALELGRPVYTVPGPIAVDSHKGCNSLLYQGAVPAIDPFVMVEDFFNRTRMERGVRHAAGFADGGGARSHESSSGGRWSRRGESEVPASADGGAAGIPRLTGPCADGILSALEAGARSVDELVGHTGLATRQVMAMLAKMEVQGLVARGGTGLFIRAP